MSIHAVLSISTGLAVKSGIALLSRIALDAFAGLPILAILAIFTGRARNGHKFGNYFPVWINNLNTPVLLDDLYYCVLSSRALWPLLAVETAIGESRIFEFTKPMLQFFPIFFEIVEAALKFENLFLQIVFHYFCTPLNYLPIPKPGKFGIFQTIGCAFFFFGASAAGGADGAAGTGLLAIYLLPTVSESW
jgi:hypothetical protein